MLLHENKTLTKAMLEYDLTKVKDRYKRESIILDAAIMASNIMDDPNNGTKPTLGETEAEHYYNAMVNAAEKVIRASLLQHLDKHRHSAGAVLVEKLAEEHKSELQWANQNASSMNPPIVRAMRQRFIKKFGFTVLTGETVHWIKQQAGDGPYVEIGAGNGYLAKELNQSGFTVFPTDRNSLDTNGYALGNVPHMAVERYDGIDALHEYQGCDVLWSWPQPHTSTADIMKNITDRKLVYIGDLHDMRNTDPESYETLQSRFRLESEHANHHFEGIQEVIAVFAPR